MSIVQLLSFNQYCPKNGNHCFSIDIGNDSFYIFLGGGIEDQLRIISLNYGKVFCRGGHLWSAILLSSLKSYFQANQHCKNSLIPGQAYPVKFN